MLSGHFCARMSHRSQQRPASEVSQSRFEPPFSLVAARCVVTSQVVSQTMRDAQVQFTAREFSKETTAAKSFKGFTCELRTPRSFSTSCSTTKRSPQPWHPGHLPHPVVGAVRPLIAARKERKTVKQLQGAVDGVMRCVALKRSPLLAGP